ncbi:MAG: GAF domain-containing protein [Anaerolineales bacterium]
MDSTTLGIIFVAVGVVFLLLTPLLLRLVPYLRRVTRSSSSPSVFPSDLPPNENAVLVVQEGGRVIYLNARAREWFNLLESDTPNLERLARNTRPNEAFLNLCAAPGRARFNLHQSLIEGVSYQMPSEGQSAIMVTLQQLQLSGLEDDGGQAAHTLSIFNEISQDMSASLDLPTTIETILESIDRLIPSDFSEITLWDQENEYLIPYRFLVDDDGVRRLKRGSDRYPVTEGYSGHMVSNQEPLIIDRVNEFTGAKQYVNRHQFPINSFLGLPLHLRGLIIGTIELASQTPEAFNQGDLEVLETLSGHAAIALQNAITHFKEQQRATEMAGLAELAQVSSTIYSTDELYQHLIEYISPLLNVEILGFLIYNEATRTLEGQVPFQGFPDQFTILYKTVIEEGSLAEKLWGEQDIIITDDMSDSSPLGLLGLSPLTQAAGIRETVLLPLCSGKHSLGYLQVANKLDGSMFTDDDLRLLRIIAGHTAPILENAHLIRQSRRRAQRAEALRRVASLAGSGATIDEILNFSAMELSRFLYADKTVLLLLDENLGRLTVHASSLVGIDQDSAKRLTDFLASETSLGETVTTSTLPLIFDDIEESLAVSPFYHRLFQCLPEVQSAITVPLIIRDRGIGELIITSTQANFFHVNDSLSAATAAGQLASALERSTLLTQTDESLQRRVDQLSTLNRIVSELNTAEDLKKLLKQVRNEVVRTTGSDEGSVLLFKMEDGSPNFHEIVNIQGPFTSEKLGTLERKAVKKGVALVADDVEKNGDNLPLANVRSYMLVPVIYLGKVIGLIQLYSKKPDHFDQFAMEVAQNLAVQAGIAISNLQRYQDQYEKNKDFSRQLGSLGKLLQTTQSLQPEMPIAESMSVIAEGIRESSVFDIVMVYGCEPGDSSLRLVAGAGVPSDQLEESWGARYGWDQLDPMIQPDYRRGDSYFIPYSKSSELPSLIPDYALMVLTIPDDSENAWQPGDRLVVPLQNNQAHPIGLIAVDAPRDGLRPDDLSIETLEFFAAEAALVIDSFQKADELRQQMTLIESEIARAEQSGPANQEYLSVMLQKDLEQTIAIQQLYDRARNIRVGLRIADMINRQPNRESVLTSLASQMLTEMELDIALVAESSEGGPRLLNQFGNLPQGSNPQALLGQRNPLWQALQTGETIFVSNLDENSEWQNTPLLKSLDTKGFISLPIASDGQVEAAVLAVSNTPLPDVTKEDEQIYDLIANQVSITLQNLNLLTETRRRLREVNLLLDFSRELGSLDWQEILNTLLISIRQVMPNAHGAMIALYDEDQAVLNTQVAAGYTDNELIQQINHDTDGSLLGKAYQQNETLIVTEMDFANQYRLSSDDLLRYREATGGRLPVSCMAVPVKTSDTTLGVVLLDNFNTPAAFSEEDIALVESLTQQTALTLENARLYEESRRLNEELEQRVAERTEELGREHQFTQTLLRISTELSSSLDLDMVLNRSLETLNQVTGGEQSTIVIIRPPQEYLIYRAGSGIHEAPPTGGRISTLKVGEGLAGWVVKHRKPVVVPDLLLDERWKKDHGLTTVYRSAISVPLTVGADALGCLMIYHREPNHFRADQIDAIQAVANQFAVTINNGELFRLIRDQAEDLGKHLRAQQIEASRSTAMLEGVADGVLVTDNNSVITLFNDAAEVILKLKREQVIGKSLEEFIGLFGGAAQSWMDTIREWSTDMSNQSEGAMYSERINLEDGRVISIHLAPVSDPKEFLGTVSIFRDITHEVEVDRLKSEFVATVSHELRTPMTPIKGYVEFLLMGGAGDLNEKQVEFLDIIKSNIDRLSTLVNDLLDVSRIEAGKVALSFQPIDIMEVLEKLTDSVRQQAEEENGRSLNFEINTPKDLPSIYGDVDRVRQILNNLLDNAYKYSPPGSKITIDLAIADDEVQVDISDEGIGIFPDEHERIFERFYRGENHLVMATAGTGLGLSIVKELVEMHDGRIWVTSTGVPDEGSTFSFTLPIYHADREEETTPIEG